MTTFYGIFFKQRAVGLNKEQRNARREVGIYLAAHHVRVTGYPTQAAAEAALARIPEPHRALLHVTDHSYA